MSALQRFLERIPHLERRSAVRAFVLSILRQFHILHTGIRSNEGRGRSRTADGCPPSLCTFISRACLSI